MNAGPIPVSIPKRWGSPSGTFGRLSVRPLEPYLRGGEGSHRSVTVGRRLESQSPRAPGAFPVRRPTPVPSWGGAVQLARDQLPALPSVRRWHLSCSAPGESPFVLEPYFERPLRCQATTAPRTTMIPRSTHQNMTTSDTWHP